MPEGNSKNLAVALDSDGDIAIDNFANVVDELLFMNSAEFAAAVPGLTPAAYQAVNASSRRTTQYLAESMSDYLQSRRRGYHGGDALQQVYMARSPIAGTTFANANESFDPANITMSRSMEEARIPEVVRNQQPDDRRQAYGRPFGIFFDEQSEGEHMGFHAGSAGVQLALDRAATDNFIYGWALHTPRPTSALPRPPDRARLTTSASDRISAATSTIGSSTDRPPTAITTTPLRATSAWARSAASPTENTTAMTFRSSCPPAVTGIGVSMCSRRWPRCSIFIITKTTLSKAEATARI